MECPQQLLTVALTVVALIAGVADYGGVAAQSFQNVHFFW